MRAFSREGEVRFVAQFRARRLSQILALGRGRVLLIQCGRLILDVADDAASRSRGIVEHHRITLRDTGQPSYPVRLESETQLVLNVVALADEVQAIPVARPVDDDQRAISRHGLEVIQVDLTQAGRLDGWFAARPGGWLAGWAMTVVAEHKSAAAKR